MMTRNSRGFIGKARYFAPLAALAVLLWTPMPRPAAAQEAAPQASPAAATVDTASVPDVQIVVTPDMSTGKWIVAAVYPGQVTKAKAMERAKSLLSLSGWKGEDLVFEDARVHPAQSFAGDKPSPTMSSVSFGTPGNVVDWQSGSMDLEPLIRAYRDLSRIHVLYMIPTGFKFHGLRRYVDDNVDVTQSGGQGAYLYVVLVKNHQLTALNLPRTQDAEAARESASASRKTVRPGGRVLFVVLLAVVAAIVAFLGVRRWNSR